MATFSLPIEQWTEATVHQVVTDRHVETMTVEFKRELPFATPAHKFEVAKDISAMANCAGGWIIYGIEEKAGSDDIKIASSCVPMVMGDTAPSNPAKWVDDIVAAHIVPRPFLRSKEITTDGGLYLVVRISASANELHMVDGRYHMRSELSARRMTQPEVKDAYSRIHFHRIDAVRFVKEIIDSEMQEEENSDFLLALVPHTLRDVINPGHIPLDDPAFRVLSSSFMRDLGPASIGTESRIGSTHRFRLRRCGAVSLMYPAIVGGRWRTEQFLAELARLVFVARSIWPRHGIYEGATFCFRARTPLALQTELPAELSFYGSGELAAYEAFDVPVEPDVLQSAPCTVLRAAMDRLFQCLGERGSHFFSSDSAPTIYAQRILSGHLAALLA